MFAEGSAGGRQMVHQFAGRRFAPKRESLLKPVNAMMADTQRSRWRMNKKLVGLIVVAILIFAGVKFFSSSGEVVPTDGPVAIGQKFVSREVTITPLEVVQDSRCPIEPNVQCIWAGTVQVKVKLESEGNVQEAVLELSSPITFVGQRVSLTVVTPATLPEKVILPNDYRFQFLVS